MYELYRDNYFQLFLPILQILHTSTFDLEARTTDFPKYNCYSIKGIMVTMHSEGLEILDRRHLL